MCRVISIANIFQRQKCKVYYVLLKTFSVLLIQILWHKYIYLTKTNIHKCQGIGCRLDLYLSTPKLLWQMYETYMQYKQ